MKEIDNDKQNCDHVFEGILADYNGGSSCANCGQHLTDNQIYLIILKSKLICQDMIKEKNRK